MKTILLISRCPPYPIHLGDRLIIWHLARELSARGYTIDLLAFTNRPEDWDEQNAYAQYFRHIHLFDEPKRGAVSYVRRLLLPSARYPKRAESAWSPAMWRAIESHLAQDDYDVVQLFGGIHVYEFAHALKGQPTVITPYESYSLYLRRVIEQGGGLLTRLQRQVARQFERFMFTPYQRTVVIAQPDKDELLGINPRLSIDVISNGIDLDTFLAQDSERDPYRLLFVGNYEYAPNVDAGLRLAREILPAVQAQIPEAKLWLVGNAPPPEIQSLSSDSIEVTGRVPDVRPYLAGAGVFVCPLTLGAGLKNKVLEALAMGIPVVATPLSVDGIDVKGVKNTPAALVTNLNSMVDSIIRVMRDETLRQSLSYNGRKLVAARYSWSQVAARYEQVYEEVTHVVN